MQPKLKKIDGKWHIQGQNIQIYVQGESRPNGVGFFERMTDSEFWGYYEKVWVGNFKKGQPVGLQTYWDIQNKKCNQFQALVSKNWSNKK